MTQNYPPGGQGSGHLDLDDDGTCSLFFIYFYFLNSIDYVVSPTPYSVI